MVGFGRVLSESVVTLVENIVDVAYSVHVLVLNGYVV